MNKTSYLKALGCILGTLFVTYLFIASIATNGWTTQNKWGIPFLVITWVICALLLWYFTEAEEPSPVKHRLNELAKTLLAVSNPYEFADTSTGRSVRVEQTPRQALVFAPRYHIWIRSSENVFDDETSEWFQVVEVTHFVFPIGATVNISKITTFFKINSSDQIVSEASTMPDKLSLRNLKRDAELTLASNHDISDLTTLLESHLPERN